MFLLSLPHPSHHVHLPYSHLLPDSWDLCPRHKVCLHKVDREGGWYPTCSNGEWPTSISLGELCYVGRAASGNIAMLAKHLCFLRSCRIIHYQHNKGRHNTDSGVEVHIVGQTACGPLQRWLYLAGALPWNMGQQTTPPPPMCSEAQPHPCWMSFVFLPCCSCDTLTPMPLLLSLLVLHRQPSNRCGAQDVLQFQYHADLPHLPLSRDWSAAYGFSVRLTATLFQLHCSISWTSTWWAAI